MFYRPCRANKDGWATMIVGLAFLAFCTDLFYNVSASIAEGGSWASYVMAVVIAWAAALCIAVLGWVIMYLIYEERDEELDYRRGDRGNSGDLVNRIV